MIERVTVVNEETLLIRIQDMDAEIETRLPMRKTGKNRKS